MTDDDFEKLARIICQHLSQPCLDIIAHARELREALRRLVDDETLSVSGICKRCGAGAPLAGGGAPSSGDPDCHVCPGRRLLGSGS